MAWSLSTQPATIATGFAFLSILYIIQAVLIRKAPLPPGPRGLPVLGNILDFPRSRLWVKFTELGKKYGGIVHVKLLGQSIIILSDVKIIDATLNQKSRTYINRPVLTFNGKLVGWEKGPALIQSGERWSQYRRLFAQFMGSPAKVEAFRDIIQHQTNRLLKNFLDSPERWTEHCVSFTGCAVLTATYDYRPNDGNDRLISLSTKAMTQFTENLNRYLVDLLPILRYAPKWMPGAGWKHEVEDSRQTLQDLVETPFSWVQQRMADSKQLRPCFVSKLLENPNMTPQQEDVIKWAAIGIYNAGGDTMLAAMECFLLGVTIQQNAQQKAHNEMVEILGSGIMPNADDRHRLPYLQALCTEILRFYTFVPTGFVHVSTEDDHYDGYLIPKGSMVIANNWSILRDPSIYSDPDIFLPERFIKSDTRNKERDPRDFIFGYGRRACPGIWFADAALWLICASWIATFDIQPKRDSAGKPLFPRPDMTDKILCHPKPFNFTMTPRPGTADIIRNLPMMDELAPNVS
ncbi:cytochrome P450 [Mycena floridula]|nr:cytochrome P450 [Mycena floridula]